jgi:hypothetical protein
MPRLFTAWLIVTLPFVCLAAGVCLAADDTRPTADSRPACGSQNQARMWPEAANHDSKALEHFIRCGELFICVRGAWHYHWEAPSVRVDQLARGSKSNLPKPAVCEVQASASPPSPDAPAAIQKSE